MHRLGLLAIVMIAVAAAYHVPNWDFQTKLCRTNMATSTACRSPGESELHTPLFHLTSLTIPIADDYHVNRVFVQIWVS